MVPTNVEVAMQEAVAVEVDLAVRPNVPHLHSDLVGVAHEHDLELACGVVGVCVHHDLKSPIWKETQPNTKISTVQPYVISQSTIMSLKKKIKKQPSLDNATRRGTVKSVEMALMELL